MKRTKGRGTIMSTAASVVCAVVSTVTGVGQEYVFLGLIAAGALGAVACLSWLLGSIGVAEWQDLSGRRRHVARAAAAKQVRILSGSGDPPLH